MMVDVTTAFVIIDIVVVVVVVVVFPFPVSPLSDGMRKDFVDSAKTDLLKLFAIVGLSPSSIPKDNEEDEEDEGGDW